MIFVQGRIFRRCCGAWKRQENENGIPSDEQVYEGGDERFLHQRWFAGDGEKASLYELLLAKRCPHALDIRTAGIVWQFLKRFSRNADGTLNINK